MTFGVQVGFWLAAWVLPPSLLSMDENMDELATELDEQLTARLRAAFGADEGDQLARQLVEAAALFAADHYDAAHKLAQPLAQQAPDIAEVRELYGLVLYRLQKWRAAARELVAFGELAQTVEQLPVLMDCHRAQGNWRKVDELWQQLRAASPKQVLLVEGLMVMAGGLADRGRLAEAIGLLEGGLKQVWGGRPNKLADTKLRVLYLLADLYDRAGDAPQAAALFEKLQRASPGYLDVAERLRELS